MESKKINKLLNKQQLELEEKLGNQGVNNKVKSKIWMFFHRKNIFMLAAFVVSLIITIMLIYGKIDAVLFSKGTLDPTLLMIGLTILFALFVAIIGTFVFFLTED